MKKVLLLALACLGGMASTYARDEAAVAPQQAPYYTLAEPSEEVLNIAFSFGKASFVTIKEAEINISTFDALRGNIETVKTKIDTSEQDGEQSPIRVIKHEKKDFAGWTKTPRVYNEGRRTMIDRAVSRAVGANSSASEFKGQGLVELYLQSTPMWFDAKTANDLHNTVALLQKELNERAFNPDTANRVELPLLAITVNNDNLLQSIDGKTWELMNRYFNVAVFRSKKVRHFFLKNRLEMVKISGLAASNSGGLIEVGVPLWERLYSLVSKEHNNFSFDDFVYNNCKNTIDLIKKNGGTIVIGALGVYGTIWFLKTQTKLLENPQYNVVFQSPTRMILDCLPFIKTKDKDKKKEGQEKEPEVRQRAGAAV